MEIPKFYETFIPILKTLENGEKIGTNDLFEKVIEKFYGGLSQQQLNEKISSGMRLIISRLVWGKAYLKKGKFIDNSERGIVKITQKGLEILKKGKLDLKELKNDKDFLESNLDSNENSEKNSTEFETKTPQDIFDEGIIKLENQTKSELLEKLKSINPYEFELIILKLLKKMGYGDFVETTKSRDGGIDGILNQDILGIEKIFVQAKRYSENKVNELEIRNFIGAMSGGTTKGIFVTTSRFDSKAIEKSEKSQNKIILINGKKLADLMYEYGVGVQIKQTIEIKEVDEDFFS